MVGSQERDSGLDALGSSSGRSVPGHFLVLLKKRFFVCFSKLFFRKFTFSKNTRKGPRGHLARDGPRGSGRGPSLVF